MGTALVTIAMETTTTVVIEVVKGNIEVEEIEIPASNNVYPWFVFGIPL